MCWKGATTTLMRELEVANVRNTLNRTWTTVERLAQRATVVQDRSKAPSCSYSSQRVGTLAQPWARSLVAVGPLSFPFPSTPFPRNSPEPIPDAET